MKQIIFFSLILLAFCCKKPEVSNQEKFMDKKAVQKTIVVKNDSKVWYVDLVENYIANSKKKLIVSDRKAKIVDWDLDNSEVCDTANYYIFKIGHTETDEENTSARFTASGWIYIDSLTQKIYEYDLPNDKLILWKNK